MTATAPQIRTKTVAEVLTATFGFSTKLGDSGAVIESATVTVSPSGPTIGSPAINDAAITVDGIDHAIGGAVQASVSGGTAGTRYTLTCTAETDDGQTLAMYAVFYVEA